MALALAACGDDESAPSAPGGFDAGGEVDSASDASGGADASGGSDGGSSAVGGAATGGASGTGGSSATGGSGGSTAGGSGGGSGAAGASASAPSCSGLARDCGPTNDDDCCASSPVPGGTFTLGRGAGGSDDCACATCDVACGSCGTVTCGSDEAGVTASVSSFRLDRYEVTVGRFRKFVEDVVATGWQPAPGSGKHTHLGGIANETGWDASWPALPTTQSSWDTALSCGITGQTWTWTSAAGANERRPINCLTWYRAYAFCIWDGGFLPTESEWEYAASGGEERIYPWSAPPASTTVDTSHASYGCLGDGIAGCTLADIVDVGTKSAGNGRWGHADLGGNLWELVLDYYLPTYAACSDCAELDPATSRVIRGGVYNDDWWSMRAANRFYQDPAVRGANAGVRCARAP